MIYIAGKNECSAAEMSRAEKMQELVCDMTGTSVSLGYYLGKAEDTQKYMAVALEEIALSDAVLFLPGWKNYKGLQMQHMYCKYIGKRVMYFKLTAKGAVLELPRNKKRRIKHGKRKLGT